MKLYVWRDGKLLETRDFVAQSTLPLGRSDYKFDYVPKEGWKPGNYTFQVRVYGFNGKLLAESNTAWLNYRPHGLEALMALGWQKLIILIIIIIIIVYILSRRKGDKVKHKKLTGKTYIFQTINFRPRPTIIPSSPIRERQHALYVLRGVL